MLTASDKTGKTKKHEQPSIAERPLTSTEQKAGDYYNDQDVNTFYRTVWGGEEIHMGIYQRPDDEIATASRRTVDRMMDCIAHLATGGKIIDLGSGYGGPARQLVRRFGCTVDCVCISSTHNSINRKQTEAAGLTDFVHISENSFEDVPFSDATFDVVWSQEAFIHGGRREQAIAEAARLLKPGGELIMTDIMRGEETSNDELREVLERLRVTTVATPTFYQKAAKDVGLETISWEDLSDHFMVHYRRLIEELESKRESLSKMIGNDKVDAIRVSLQRMFDVSEMGHIRWGILRFCKPVR